jgi:UDP-3-O-acyl-N-acetylglucosamine deacetylase
MVFARPSNGNAQCTINEIVPWVGIGLHSGDNIATPLQPDLPFANQCALFDLAGMIQ